MDHILMAKPKSMGMEWFPTTVGLTPPSSKPPRWGHWADPRDSRSAPYKNMTRKHMGFHWGFIEPPVKWAYNPYKTDLKQMGGFLIGVLFHPFFSGVITRPI